MVSTTGFGASPTCVQVMVLLLRAVWLVQASSSVRGESWPPVHRVALRIECVQSTQSSVLRGSESWVCVDFGVRREGQQQRWWEGQKLGKWEGHKWPRSLIGVIGWRMNQAEVIERWEIGKEDRSDMQNRVGQARVWTPGYEVEVRNGGYTAGFGRVRGIRKPYFCTDLC